MDSQDIERFLQEPRIAHLATVRPSGAPHVAPVWFLYRDGKVLVVTEPSSVKVRNIRQNPQVVLSIATDAAPYRYVLVRGSAQVVDDGTEEVFKEVSRHYKESPDGESYAEKLLREADFCTLSVTPSRVTGWASE